MNIECVSDEGLVKRLPLPLGQLYRRAHNAQGSTERFWASFYLWEAALKLIGSIAIVEYLHQGRVEDEIADRLTALTRPSNGHWWEFTRMLLPRLAVSGRPEFVQAADLLLGTDRSDLPRVVGLAAVLDELLDGKRQLRQRVKVRTLFDQLIRFRNERIAHGAIGLESRTELARLGQSLLLGVAQLLESLKIIDSLRLQYLADVRREPHGSFLVERFELVGETPRKLDALELPATVRPDELPCPQRLFLRWSNDDPGAKISRMLYPLLLYDLEANEVLVLSASRRKRRADYHGYTSARTRKGEELAADQRALLAQILGTPVDAATFDAWAGRYQNEALVHEVESTELSTEPRQMGEYELLSRLGIGGMGVVYRARHQALGREVALKSMLRPGNPVQERRFAREIRAWSLQVHC